MTYEGFGKMMVQEYQNAEGEHFRLVNEFFNEFRMRIDGYKLDVLMSITMLYFINMRII
jgi:toxin-antitoxin system, antitoxin component, ribbon-helix-helix domain protein